MESDVCESPNHVSSDDVIIAADLQEKDVHKEIIADEPPSADQLNEHETEVNNGEVKDHQNIPQNKSGTRETKGRHRTVSEKTISGFEARNTSTVLWGMSALKNIRVFLALISVVMFLDGAMTAYTAAVIKDIGKRYSLAKYEDEFVIGMRLVGFVFMLIFIGLLGNRFHKPFSIAIGCWINAIVAFLMVLPYIINGTFNNRFDVSNYSYAGLCLTGPNIIQYADGQCSQLNKNGSKTAAFSLFCLGQFFFGIGSAFYVTLGIVYTADNGKPKDLPLHIGK